MNELAHVRSKYTPPAVVFIDGELRYPFRIYSNKNGTLCAILSEIPLRSDGFFPVASSLLDWIEEKGAKEIVILDGIPVRRMPSKRQAFCAAENEKLKICKEKGLEMVSGGVIIGMTGSLLNECLTRKITGVAFLTPAVTNMPDPEGATTLIDTVNDMYTLKVDTQELVDQAEEIKLQLKELAQRHQKMRNAEETKGVPERLYA
jgi:uncharacterized protein